MLKLLLIIVILFIGITMSFAQRNSDSGGRGTESTKINRIKRVKTDSRTNLKTEKFKDRKPYIPNQTVQPSGEIGICGGVVDPKKDVFICSDYSPDVYSKMNIDLDQSSIDLGLQKFDDGDYYGAISIFDEEININPNKKELYFWRGKSLLAVSEFEKAIRDFSIAIIFDNYYTEAYYQRGLAHFYRGDRNKSKEDLNYANSLGYSRAGYILNKYF